MTKPAGVQWFGSIGPNAAPLVHLRLGRRVARPVDDHAADPLPRRATAHVVGRRRARERNPVHVLDHRQNLTSDPVKFEGRYDVLSW